jgi:hypothetical protein
MLVSFRGLFVSFLGMLVSLGGFLASFHGMLVSLGRVRSLVPDRVIEAETDR